MKDDGKEESDQEGEHEATKQQVQTAQNTPAPQVAAAASGAEAVRCCAIS
jgi:hypothetical protein